MIQLSINKNKANDHHPKSENLTSSFYSKIKIITRIEIKVHKWRKNKDRSSLVRWTKLNQNRGGGMNRINHSNKKETKSKATMEKGVSKLLRSTETRRRIRGFTAPWAQHSPATAPHFQHTNNPCNIPDFEHQQNRKLKVDHLKKGKK